jgi:hypothetical protein
MAETDGTLLGNGFSDFKEKALLQRKCTIQIKIQSLHQTSG